MESPRRDGLEVSENALQEMDVKRRSQKANNRGKQALL
jgi:hypothetical protein